MIDKKLKFVDYHHDIYIYEYKKYLNIIDSEDAMLNGIKEIFETIITDVTNFKKDIKLVEFMGGMYFNILDVFDKEFIEVDLAGIVVFHDGETQKIEIKIKNPLDYYVSLINNWKNKMIFKDKIILNLVNIRNNISNVLFEKNVDLVLIYENNEFKKYSNLSEVQNIDFNTYKKEKYISILTFNSYNKFKHNQAINFIKRFK